MNRTVDRRPDGVYRVMTFNPASNANQESRLRLTEQHRVWRRRVLLRVGVPSLPNLTGSGEGVRVGVREHPADGRVRRRRAAPVGVAPRPQGAQFALVEAAREPFRRRRPALPGEPRQGADRQHRRQAVLAPLTASAVGHRREQVAQLRPRVAHRRRPARPLRSVDRTRPAAPPRPTIADARTSPSAPSADPCTRRCGPTRVQFEAA